MYSPERGVLADETDGPVISAADSSLSVVCDFLLWEATEVWHCSLDSVYSQEQEEC